MTWAEVNLDERTWTLSPARMKAQRGHVVALSPAAIAILAGLPHGAEDDFVFGGKKSMRSRKLLELLQRLRPGVVTHGFRASFRTWAGDCTHHAREIIEAALAHRLGDAAEQAYNRGQLLQKRLALMADWAGYLGGPRGGVVVDLRPAS
jgi:integrase